MQGRLKCSGGDAERFREAGRGWRSGSIQRTSARRFVLILVPLAVFSTIAGYEVARLEPVWGKWLDTSHVQAASVSPPAPKRVSAPEADTRNNALAAISRLKPQQQAERLLELAIHHDTSSLDLIRQNLEDWRGHVQDTDSLFQLVLAALDSADPRVRTAALEVDLVANDLRKSPQSVEKLLRQIRKDREERYLALWRLGALGNRGVEPDTVLSTLRRYAHDKDQETRFWAVEGLAVLGTDESLDPLLFTLAHDPSLKVRQRAACDLGHSGMFTEEQRLAAVPHLLNLLDDDSLDLAAMDLVYATLQTISKVTLGRDPEAWREWWAHHDRPEKRANFSTNMTLA